MEKYQSDAGEKGGGVTARVVRSQRPPNVMAVNGGTGDVEDQKQSGQGTPI